LEINSELKELNATKDKFFGIIAHDLKNPFCGLMAASELLIDYADQFDKENIKNISLLLHDSAKQGHALLENLLEWSRSQTGKLEFNPQKLNVKDVVEENISNMRSHAMNKNIDLKFEIAEGLEVVADKEMINTILRNLLSNAVKFTPKHGKISISVIKLQEQITIRVADTGIGISQENIRNLFRMDVMYTRIGTEQEKGTGLGLLLCKEFVEKHEGKIWVESQVGKGSEFQFTIPSKCPKNFLPQMEAGSHGNI
jgi:signal transduction histidine kinase